MNDALQLLKPGGLYIVDDMLPQPQWPADHAPKVPRLIAALEARADLLVTRLNKDLTLYADGKGHWYDATGTTLSSLDGCLDVDIAVTPFTNTLPIRRLELPLGSPAITDVAYTTAPELQVKIDQQQYTCVEQNDNGWLYRYESLDSGFVAILPVDREGLVLDYPGLFRRVWSN